MKTIFFWLFSGILLFLVSCKKEPQTPIGSNKIIIGSTTVDSATYFKIAVSTQVTNLNGNSIKQHGYCWGTVINPGISGNHSSLGPLSGPGKFSEQITGLNPGTRYFIRPYLTNAYGTLYGLQVEDTTVRVSKPIIIIDSITEITCTSAKANVTVLADGGYAVTNRGVCWNTDTLNGPSLHHFLDTTNNGTGKVKFTAILKNLVLNKTYYAVAYAINAVDTSYCNIKSFSTSLNPPVAPTEGTHVPAPTQI